MNNLKGLIQSPLLFKIRLRMYKHFLKGGIMQQGSFYNMFVELLKDLFDAENQIIEALPKMIQAASHTDLKDIFSQHLEETKNQVKRLQTIFRNLNENPTGRTCKGMKGLITEGQEEMNKLNSSAVKDAFMIVAAQKIEHYEISAYGSARTLAHHLGDVGLSDRIDFDEVVDLLQQTLDEESDADEKLTQIAEGGLFTSGINKEAEQEYRQQQGQGIQQGQGVQQGQKTQQKQGTRSTRNTTRPPREK